MASTQCLCSFPPGLFVCFPVFFSKVVTFSPSIISPSLCLSPVTRVFRHVSPHLPTPLPACVGLAFALLMVQPFGLYGGTAARAMWAVLPSLGSTGCFVSFRTLTPGAQTAKPAPGTSLWAWRIPKKTPFQVQVSILPNDTGRFRPTSTVQCLTNTSHSNVLFLFQNVHSFSSLAIYTPGEALHHSLVFIEKKQNNFLAAKRLITYWFFVSCLVICAFLVHFLLFYFCIFSILCFLSTLFSSSFVNNIT